MNIPPPSFTFDQAYDAAAMDAQAGNTVLTDGPPAAPLSGAMPAAPAGPAAGARPDLTPAGVARRPPPQPPLAAGGAARNALLWWVLGLLLVLTEALALGTYWWQSQRSAGLLSALGSLRAAARAAYNSQQGYGLVPGAPVRLGGVGAGGWPMAEVQLRSQVSTFSLSLEGVSPLVCAQVLPRIDTGWSELRYNGQLLAVPVSVEQARAACGWLRTGQLELVSSG